MKVYGYIRVSTNEQNTDSQKNIISRYCIDHRLLVDEWISIEKSSRSSTEQRRIEELITKIEIGDIVIISELSRLGRSIKEVLDIIERLTLIGKVRLVLVKQNIDLDPNNQKDIANKVLITMFAMMAELERDFISERTKEGLAALKARGVILGKPKGTIQVSMYDKDRSRIMELYEMGVSINAIIQKHLHYGKYLSLKKYIQKIQKKNTAPPIH